MGRQEATLHFLPSLPERENMAVAPAPLEPVRESGDERGKPSAVWNWKSGRCRPLRWCR